MAQTQVQSTTATPNLPAYQGTQVSVKKSPFLEGLNTFVKGMDFEGSQKAAREEAEKDAMFKVLADATSFAEAGAAKLGGDYTPEQFLAEQRTRLNRKLIENRIDPSKWAPVSSMAEKQMEPYTKQHIFTVDKSVMVVPMYGSGKARVLYAPGMSAGTDTLIETIANEDVKRVYGDKAKKYGFEAANDWLTQKSYLTVEGDQASNYSQVIKMQTDALNLTEKQKEPIKQNAIYSVKRIVSNDIRSNYQDAMKRVSAGENPEVVSADFKALSSSALNNASVHDILKNGNVGPNDFKTDDVNTMINSMAASLKEVGPYKTLEYNNKFKELNYESELLRFQEGWSESERVLYKTAPTMSKVVTAAYYLELFSSIPSKSGGSKIPQSMLDLMQGKVTSESRNPPRAPATITDAQSDLDNFRQDSAKLLDPKTTQAEAVSYPTAMYLIKQGETILSSPFVTDEAVKEKVKARIEMLKARFNKPLNIEAELNPE